MYTEEKIVRMILSIIKENLPDDCSWLVDELERKLIKDIRDLGVEKALEKYYFDENDEKIKVEIEG